MRVRRRFGALVVPHERAEEMPPPPPGVRYVSVPRLGVVVADDALRARVDHVFHWPMILLALAILPLLAIEFTRHPVGWVQWAIDVGFGIIWLAFVIELVVKISIAESRKAYLVRNWLDLVVIALPVLRPLRLSSLARTSRVFRLRGVSMKFARELLSIILGLEATERLMNQWKAKRGVEGGLKDPTKMTRHELMAELRRQRKLVGRWEIWYAAHRLPMPDAPVLEPSPDVDPPDPLQALKNEAGG